MKNQIIAAAVAAVVASAASPMASAALTMAQAKTYTKSLVVAGSSAAKTAIQNSVKANICAGGQSLNDAIIITSSSGVSGAGNTNFTAIACTSNSALGGGIVAVFYRAEGGSVVGALPIVTGYQPWRLNLQDASCVDAGAGVATCTVNGTSAANGISDSFTGAVVRDTVQLGMTDVEPGALTQKDFPTDYTKSVWDPNNTIAGASWALPNTLNAVSAKMAALNKIAAFQQVFGLAVNTTGLNSAALHADSRDTTGVTKYVNLSRESIANILSGSVTNWNQVPDAATGLPLATTSVPIQVVNREAGSGTRTSVNTYFFNYQCSGATAAINAGLTNKFFAGGDAVKAAAGNDPANLPNATGAITYSSIDGLYPFTVNANTANLANVYLNGIQPSTLAAAAGQYDLWFEATLVPNPTTAGDSLTLMNLLTSTGGAPTKEAASIGAQVNFIPSYAGNTASVNVPSTATSGGTGTNYVNPYSRAGASCNAPKSFL